MKYSSGGIEFDIDVPNTNKDIWRKALKDAELDPGFIIVSTTPVNVKDNGDVVITHPDGDVVITHQELSDKPAKDQKPVTRVG